MEQEQGEQTTLPEPEAEEAESAPAESETVIAETVTSNDVGEQTHTKADADDAEEGEA